MLVKIKNKMTNQKSKIINLNKLKTNHLRFKKAGSYVIFFKNLSGDFTFEIKAKKVDLKIYGLFIGKGSDKFNLKTKQWHLLPESSSSLLIKGVFDGQSRFIHKGLIRIEKKAQKSRAFEKNQNLLLSDKAYVDTRPYLEILANHVYCTHGTSTGRLNKNQIYYLESRGIAEKSAKRLLVDGFINEVLCLMPTK